MKFAIMLLIDVFDVFACYEVFDASIRAIYTLVMRFICLLLEARHAEYSESNDLSTIYAHSPPP